MDYTRFMIKNPELAYIMAAEENRYRKVAALALNLGLVNIHEEVSAKGARAGVERGREYIARQTLLHQPDVSYTERSPDSGKEFSRSEYVGYGDFENFAFQSDLQKRIFKEASYEAYRDYMRRSKDYMCTEESYIEKNLATINASVSRSLQKITDLTWRHLCDFDPNQSRFAFSDSFHELSPVKLDEIDGKNRGTLLAFNGIAAIADAYKQRREDDPDLPLSYVLNKQFSLQQIDLLCTYVDDARENNTDKATADSQ